MEESLSPRIQEQRLECSTTTKYPELLAPGLWLLAPLLELLELLEPVSLPRLHQDVVLRAAAG